MRSRDVPLVSVGSFGRRFALRRRLLAIPPRPLASDPTRLKKSLTLFDVYAVRTGAMFSSGFFLLPGLATAQAGPAAILAYLLAGVLILPAMFSIAELSTAMPKSGGTYYFLDRSLGPLAGTVGGIGTWLALVLKSAFALIGMGAYLVLFFEDVPIKPIAVALTVAFCALNVFGAKETTGFSGCWSPRSWACWRSSSSRGSWPSARSACRTCVAADAVRPVRVGQHRRHDRVWFASYAGLTKVTSVAEEVQNPDRNIPLGMMLSLVTATFIYVVGVFIMVSVLDPTELRSDLTPVATAAEAFFTWLPGDLGLILIVVAAIAAFASTGNAGILSASRYPYAMARDHLVAARLGVLGRFGTPVTAVLATSGLMIAVILPFDVEGIAKLASAFQLIIFGLINVAVVVMRESRIPSYVPGYRSPFYPWLQIVGILTPLVLVAQLARCGRAHAAAGAGRRGVVRRLRRNNPLVERDGAIYHLFERLGRRRYAGLDGELRTILKDKGIEDETPFEHLVTHGDRAGDPGRRDVRRGHAGGRRAARAAPAAVGRGARGARSRRLALWRHAGLARRGAAAPPPAGRRGVAAGDGAQRRRLRLPSTPTRRSARGETVYAVFFLVSPEEPPGAAPPHARQHRQPHRRGRRSGPLAAARADQELKETLLRNDRYPSVTLGDAAAPQRLVGKPLRETAFPAGTLVALIRRDGPAPSRAARPSSSPVTTSPSSARPTASGRSASSTAPNPKPQ